MPRCPVRKSRLSSLPDHGNRPRTQSLDDVEREQPDTTCGGLHEHHVVAFDGAQLPPVPYQAVSP